MAALLGQRVSTGVIDGRTRNNPLQYRRATAGRMCAKAVGMLRQERSLECVLECADVNISRAVEISRAGPPCPGPGNKDPKELCALAQGWSE